MMQVGTFGVDYKLKEVTINDELVMVQVWDTAGQVRGVCQSWLYSGTVKTTTRPEQLAVRVCSARHLRKEKLWTKTQWLAVLGGGWFSTLARG